MIRADPARIDAVAEQVEATLGPVGMDVEQLPPLGYAGAAVAPTVAVEVTTLWIAMAVAVTAGVFVVAQAVGRQLAAGAAEDRTRDCTRNHDDGTGHGQVADAGAGRRDRCRRGAGRGVVTERLVSDRAGAAGRAAAGSALRHRRGRCRGGDDAGRDPDPHRGPGVARITPPTSAVSRRRRRRHACSPARPSPSVRRSPSIPGVPVDHAPARWRRWQPSPWGSPPCWP